MQDKELKKYIQELILKYDYYSPIKDRTESLRFSNIKNKKILDIGTGKGYLAIIAAKDFNCQVTSIDLSKEKIGIAKENAKKEDVLDKIKFKLNDASNLPFSNNSFDAVISFNALHHANKKYKKIIKQMFRVAKDKIVITELNAKGARIFDEFVHPGENHQSMAIGLKELESGLKQLGNVKRFDRKIMSTFICEKSHGGK